ncbi:MAG: hypothetical protein AB7I59_05835 [Geminicoccaceae bacterium]
MKLPDKSEVRRWLALRRKKVADDGHIIISGTGRSGTTLLVQLFTHLGFDTGFDRKTSLSSVDRISHAGLERSLREDELPYIVKSPWFVDEVDEVLRDGSKTIRAAIVPVRDLVEAAESRRRVWREATRQRLDPLRHPGTIWKTEEPAEQENVLAVQFYKVVNALVAHEIPVYLLSFPRFAQDGRYFYRTLRPIFKMHQVPRDDVLQEHKRIVKTRLIHDFTQSSIGLSHPGG